MLVCMIRSPDQTHGKYLLLLGCRTLVCFRRGTAERENMAGKAGYWLMDGRANYDVDAATVLEHCDTLAEAKRNINDYGADTCIVDIESQKVVDSLMWRSMEVKVLARLTKHLAKRKNMTKREFQKWLKSQADLNTFQELYAITLEGNHGIECVKAWIDGEESYYDPIMREKVVFLMSSPQNSGAVTVTEDSSLCTIQRK